MRCAGSKLAPPGDLVAHLIHCMATSNRIAHNCSAPKAREVIPQPTLQPNTSKETRRCWRRARGPCPVQTFLFFFFFVQLLYDQASGLDREQAPFRFFSIACLSVKSELINRGHGAHSRTHVIVAVSNYRTLACFLPARRLLALTVRGLCQQPRK